MDGEWWIDEDGTAHYADGDIGDINHENYVVVHCMYEVISQFEASSNALPQQLAGYLDSFINSDGVDIIAVREFIINWSDGLHRDGQLTDEQADDIFRHLQELSGVEEDMLNVAFDMDADARKYGILTLGWIRLAGKDATCRRLDRRTLRQLDCGIYDAMGEQDVRGLKMDIDTFEPPALYTGIPFTVIEAGNVGSIKREYQSSIRVNQ
jgi:hypothetical protein